MANPATGEVRFEHAGEPYRLVFDMTAIAAFEDETGLSIIEVAGQMDAAQSGARPPKLSTLGSLLAAGLARHHPEVTRIEAMEMFADPAVRAALGSGLTTAMPEGDASAEGNARAPAKPKRKAGTGRR